MDRPTPEPPRRDVPWVTVSRWQEYEGERRANLLRVVAIAAFYTIELINHYGLNLGVLELSKGEGVSDSFHQAVTALALAWTMLGLGVHVCVRNRIFPKALKFLSTGGDLAFMTAILAIAEGPRSALVAGYFLLIPLSGLRFNLVLVRFATGGAIAGYLYLLGFARWFTERDIGVPRYHQLIVLLALGLTGVFVGQIIRKVPVMARDYADRTRDREEPTS